MGVLEGLTPAELAAMDVARLAETQAEVLVLRVAVSANLSATFDALGEAQTRRLSSSRREARQGKIDEIRLRSTLRQLTERKQLCAEALRTLQSLLKAATV